MCSVYEVWVKNETRKTEQHKTWQHRGSPCTRTHTKYIKKNALSVDKRHTSTLSHYSNFMCVCTRVVWRVKIGLGIYFLLFSLYLTIWQWSTDRKKGKRQQQQQKNELKQFRIFLSHVHRNMKQIRTQAHFIYLTK